MKKIAKSFFFSFLFYQKYIEMRENNRVFFMVINLNLMLVLGSGIGDGLGSNISNTPYDSWADDLSFNWVDSQGILVPFPQLQHFPKSMYVHERKKFQKIKKKERETERESDIKKETSITGFGRSCPFGLSFWQRPEYSDAPLI